MVSPGKNGGIYRKKESHMFYNRKSKRIISGVIIGILIVSMIAGIFAGFAV